MEARESWGMMAERSEKTAQFARVAARIREDITAGRLRPGDRVDGEIALAGRYGVSRGVIQRALAMLRDEGLLHTIHGQGSFVAAAPPVGVVRVGPDDRALCRMPEDAERAGLGMAPGVPVIVVTRAGSGAHEIYDAAVHVISGDVKVPSSAEPEEGTFCPG